MMDESTKATSDIRRTGLILQGHAGEKPRINRDEAGFMREVNERRQQYRHKPLTARPEEKK